MKAAPAAAAAKKKQNKEENLTKRRKNGPLNDNDDCAVLNKLNLCDMCAHRLEGSSVFFFAFIFYIISLIPCKYYVNSLI